MLGTQVPEASGAKASEVGFEGSVPDAISLRSGPAAPVALEAFKRLAFCAQLSWTTVSTGANLQAIEDEAQMLRLGKKRNTYAWLRRVLREILAIYPSRDDACLHTVASHVEDGCFCYIFWAYHRSGRAHATDTQ